MPKPLSPEDVARALNGLTSPYAARRKDDARTLERIIESNEEIVGALQKLAMTDPDSGVRQVALSTLNAPVHQPIAARLKARQEAEQEAARAAASTSAIVRTQNQPPPEASEASSALTPATLTQWLAWTQLPPRRSASPDEIRRLLKSIKDGSLDDRLQAIDQLRETKPREAVPELLKMAGGGLLSDHERRVAAIMALGVIGDAIVVPDLLRMKMLITAEEIAICCALTQIGSATAIPHWKNRIVFPDLAQRAFSAIGLSRTGQAEVVSILIERLPREGGAMVDVAKRLDGVNDRIKAGPFLVHVSGPSSATWLHRGILFGRIGGAALGTVLARKTVFKNSYGLVDWHIDFSTIEEAPADFAKMWLYHLWWAGLNHLTGQCGLAPLLVYRRQGKTSIHRLMVELVALRQMPDDANVSQALEASCSAKDYCERILSYEGWLALAELGHAVARQKVLRGLRDSDTRVRAAVGAAILSRSVESLTPDALLLANDASADVRASLLVPIALLAAMGHSPAAGVLTRLAQRDGDAGIRQQASSLSAALDDIPFDEFTPEAIALPQAEAASDAVPPTAAPIVVSPSPVAAQSSLAAPPRATIFCMKCGTQNAVTHKFCLKCGTALVQ